MGFLGNTEVTKDAAPWASQFANDPRNDGELYLELLRNEDAEGEVRRGDDGELFLVFYDNPSLIVPFRWLAGLLSRAETLPAK